MKRVLFLHQQRSFDETQRRRSVQRHFGIFYEMRLGKTLLTIRWLVREASLSPEKSPHAILVVAPMTVLESWTRELSLEGEYHVILSGLSKEKRLRLVEEVFESEHGDRVWVLTNYESLRVTGEIAFLKWFGVVLDESTNVKNPSSQISQLCTAGFRTVDHRAALSGSPTPQHLLDIFQQMKYLFGSFMSHTNFYDFRNTHFEIDPRTYDWVPRKGIGLKIKDLIHTKCFVLRRRDVGMGNKKIHEIRYVEMCKEQKDLYRQIKEDFEATFINPKNSDEEIFLSTDYAIVKATWLSRVAGGSTPGKALRDERGRIIKVLAEPVFKWDPKVKELISLLKGELSEELVLVYFHFNEEIRGVASALGKAGIEYHTIYGDDKLNTREERVRKMEAFRKGKVKVLLCQVKVVKFGIDLSASSTIVWFSETYDGLDTIQGNDRIEHPSKKEPLLYIYLHARGTIDSDIHDVAMNKSADSKMFMTNLKEAWKKRKSQRK